MIISENEGDLPEGVSKEEATKVAREIAEELGLSFYGSKIYHNCGQVIENRNWYAHQEGHRAQVTRRRGRMVRLRSCLMRWMQALAMLGKRCKKT